VPSLSIPGGQDSYDSAGRLARIDRGNGTATTSAYDALGRLARLTHLDPSASVVEQYDMTYDAAGNPAMITSSAGVTTYSYDAASRLVRVDSPDG
jgi:YD repeat-containing protein